MKEKKAGNPAGILISFIRPLKFEMITGSIAVLASVVIDLYCVHFIKNIVSAALKRNSEAIINLSLAMFGIVLLGMIVKYIVKYLAVRCSTLVVNNIQDRMYHHLSKLPFSYIQKHHSGEIVSRLTNDLSLIQNFLQNDLFNLLYIPVISVATLVFMWTVNWKLLLLTTVVIPVTVFLVGVISNPVSGHMKKFQETMAGVNALAQDCIYGIHILKAYNLETVLNKKYQQDLDKALDQGLRLEWMRALIAPFMLILQLVPVLLCIIFGGYMVVKGQLGIPGLTAFFQLLNYLLKPLATLPGIMYDLRSVGGASAHLFEIIQQPVEREDGNDYDIDTVVTPVEFKNVTFHYEGSNKGLNHLNLKVKKGQITALVGSSGSGKSTFLNLICGHYEPQEGTIHFFGQELTAWNLEALRKKVAIVSQNIYIFPGTIGENIACGNRCASREEIIEAAKVANAHEFITGLPNGYETVVGENGSGLSGGQKQRLAIARAILKDAPLLLLDEPTSALDTQSEALMQEAIYKLMWNKTVIVIAHRLSTIKEADVIYVLRDGVAVECGSHEELSRQDGYYAKLYQKQSAGLAYQAVEPYESTTSA